MKFQNNLRVSHATSRGKSISIGSSSNLNYRWRNCMMDKRTCDIASGVWEFGKLIGVSSTEPERDTVKRLKQLENRDRLAAGKELGGGGGS